MPSNSLKKGLLGLKPQFLKIKTKSDSLWLIQVMG